MSAPVSQEILIATHDGVKLKADLVKPSGQGPFPALILVHGGGWIKGSKDKWKNWGPHLASLGIASFAISYRLSKPGQPTYLQTIWDVRSGIQYAKHSAKELGLDPRRIGGMGTSAGAHLVALMALAGDDPTFKSPYADEPAQSQSAKLDLAVVMCGIYDMIAQWEHDQVLRPKEHITELYMGGDPMSIRREFYECSPVYHASSSKCDGTRWLVAWGTADDVVDYKTQALPFMTHLNRAGALVRTVELAGADHFWTTESVDSNPHNRMFAERLAAFLHTWAGW